MILLLKKIDDECRFAQTLGIDHAWGPQRPHGNEQGRLGNQQVSRYDRKTMRERDQCTHLQKKECTWPAVKEHVVETE